MNKSGIKPVGDRILVKPVKLETTTAGGIVIPETEVDKRQDAQSIGVVVDIGPDCWRHTVSTVKRLIDGHMKVVEEKSTGYSEPFCEVGDRVAFAKYCGAPMPGHDGEEYRMLNDEDITAVVSENVAFTDIESRKAVS